MLGSGLAWASILATGAMGNLFNALIRPGAHTSVGASTAVFAALGLVAAFAWKRRSYPNEPKLARWAPLVGAVVLLSYLGMLRAIPAAFVQRALKKTDIMCGDEHSPIAIGNGVPLLGATGLL